MFIDLAWGGLRMFRLVVVILLCALLPARSLAAPPDEITGTAHAKDGDDLIVAGTDVRLHGIDAFEHNQTCARDGDPVWPCGSEATQALDRLVAAARSRL